MIKANLLAGMQALREGGTAADAAIATALMQVTAFAGANVSFAGVVQLVYFDAATDPLLSRAEPVPAGAYPPELLSTLKLSVRELPLQQVSSLRGTVAFAILAGQHLESVEVPRILNFADAN